MKSFLFAHNQFSYIKIMIFYFMIKFLIVIFFIFFLFLLYLSTKINSDYIRSFNFLIIFVILSSILFLCLSEQNNNTEKKYISPKFDGERIKPGFFQ
ncbi:MAG: hypothetical protein CMN01_03220 [Rickettsiales bacterium]|nr:hypothetical protein [Rickettsiales bacterium]